MILIADSGSTKANWCLVAHNGELAHFTTEGYNPHFVDEDYIINSLTKSLPDYINHQEIEEINFYGSGCMAGKTVIVESALHSLFKSAKVNASVDLLAAARALLWNEPGFAAILGTGTNTCIYDGKQITHNIDSLGYMLGDEGSGSYIGKKILQDYMRGYMPETLSEKFSETTGLSFDEIMDRVYTQPMANRFCAGFTRFANENIDTPYFHDLVKNAFVDFFTNLVSRYPGYQNYSFNCLGSIGFYFKDILEEVATSFDMRTDKIIRSSMEELVKYHLQYK
jgi:N-acetylglucosamine kinase-like BadF-type ATPase